MEWLSDNTIITTWQTQTNYVHKCFNQQFNGSETAEFPVGVRKWKQTNASKAYMTPFFARTLLTVCK